MSRDGIGYTTGGSTSFVGKDAVKFFAAVSLVHSIKLYLNTGIKASRLHTPGNMAAKATEFTGKRYSSRRKGLEQAMADVHQWAETMRAALPKTLDGKDVP